MAKDNKRRLFPILQDPFLKAVPWELLAPHEHRAMANHGAQSLERLADRGGLGVEELFCVLSDIDWVTGAHFSTFDAYHLIFDWMAEHFASKTVEVSA